MIDLPEVKQLHIELTTRCNAHCPQCPRNYRGYEVNTGYPLTELSLDDIKKILPTDFLKQLTEVQLTGNLGDFGLARDALDIVEYLATSGVRLISISTNASMRSPDWWAKLASPNVQIIFGIDGLSDTHTLYRQGTDWHKIMANAHAFIHAGGNAIWQFIPFEFNQHQLEKCKALSKDMGFRKFIINDQGRNTGPVFDRKGNFSHWLKTEHSPIPDVHEMVTNHVTWFDQKTIQHDLDHKSLQINCLTKNTKSIYLAADGSVYPCCFLGFYPGQMSFPGNCQLEPMASENNALIWGLEHSIKWFYRVEQSWKHNSVKTGRLHTCVSTCAVR